MKSDEIKKLLKSGDVAGAQAAARDWLSREPDHAEAKMLYGTCCHLLGDDKTFGEIHEELAPQMAQETDSARLSLWRRYDEIWVGVIIGVLVFAGAAVGVWYWGSQIVGMFGAAKYGDAAYNYTEKVEQRVIRSIEQDTMPINRDNRMMNSGGCYDNR